MKIGVMLRHLDQHGGGVLVYTRNLLRELLALESGHEFVFLYQNESLLGTYGDHENVREMAVTMPSTILWDQAAVAWVERREQFDVLFNPKYSLPLLSKSPGLFALHGLDWYVMPWGSRWTDRLNHHMLIPRYAHKAAGIVAISETVRQHIIEYLGVEPEKVHKVLYGVDERFRQPITPEMLAKTRQDYKLPERFFLYSGQIYPPKNFGRLLQAYAQVGPALGISLVVAGEHRWLSQDEIQLIEELKLHDWVVWPGWIERDTIPAFYALAEALLLPSLYEGFGLPVMEAMACGTPVVTSNRYATKELAEGVGVLVDPEDVENIADGMRRIVTDRRLHEQMARAGKQRAQEFSWQKCAQGTLRVLEHIGEMNGR